MSVKVCCAVVLVLAVFLPTSTQAQAQSSAECGAAMAELMGCVQSYEVDFERLEDPSYIPELCRETMRLGGCLEAAKGKCPSHPFFEGQEAGSMAHMLAQLQTMCPQPSGGDGEGGAPTNTACPNPIQEMSKCSRIMDSLSPNGPCESDSVGMTTVILFHCPGDPMPYFRYDQLRAGNFLCYRNAIMHFFFLDGTAGFRIDDPSHIHIIEP